MTIVVDGYNAPVTAGNFVDLVNRGFYNGLVRLAPTYPHHKGCMHSRVLCPDFTMSYTSCECRRCRGRMGLLCRQATLKARYA